MPCFTVLRSIKAFCSKRVILRLHRLHRCPRRREIGLRVGPRIDGTCYVPIALLTYHEPTNQFTPTSHPLAQQPHAFLRKEHSRRRNTWTLQPTVQSFYHLILRLHRFPLALLYHAPTFLLRRLHAFFRLRLHPERFFPAAVAVRVKMRQRFV